VRFFVNRRSLLTLLRNVLEKKTTTNFRVDQSNLRETRPQVTYCVKRTIFHIIRDHFSQYDIVVLCGKKKQISISSSPSNEVLQLISCFNCGFQGNRFRANVTTCIRIDFQPVTHWKLKKKTNKIFNFLIF
jgi:hypothetical protein